MTREFCETCGTHLTTRRPGLSAVILKIGTLDDPGFFDRPQMAIFTIDKQPFHLIPDDLPQFERMPPRPPRAEAAAQTKKPAAEA